MGDDRAGAADRLDAARIGGSGEPADDAARRKRDDDDARLEVGGDERDRRSAPCGGRTRPVRRRAAAARRRSGEELASVHARTTARPAPEVPGPIRARQAYRRRHRSSGGLDEASRCSARRRSGPRRLRRVRRRVGTGPTTSRPRNGCPRPCGDDFRARHQSRRRLRELPRQRPRAPPLRSRDAQADALVRSRRRVEARRRLGERPLGRSHPRRDGDPRPRRRRPGRSRTSSSSAATSSSRRSRSTATFSSCSRTSSTAPTRCAATTSCGTRCCPARSGGRARRCKMQGRAGQVVASPDGEWLLTLYVEHAVEHRLRARAQPLRQSAGLHRAAAVRAVRRERPRAMDAEAPRGRADARRDPSGPRARRHRPADRTGGRS